MQVARFAREMRQNWFSVAFALILIIGIAIDLWQDFLQSLIGLIAAIVLTIIMVWAGEVMLWFKGTPGPQTPAAKIRTKSGTPLALTMMKCTKGGQSDS